VTASFPGVPIVHTLILFQVHVGLGPVLPSDAIPALTRSTFQFVGGDFLISLPLTAAIRARVRRVWIAASWSYGTARSSGWWTDRSFSYYRQKSS
jgi:hypothetical protein